MLGAEVLASPDYGEPFRRSLKTNALYAKRVLSRIPIVPDEFIARGLEGSESAHRQPLNPTRPAMDHARAYMDFVLRE